MSLGKRVAITLAVLALPFILGLLITYQVIRVDWISFMEIQPSFRPMEDPLPLPARSVPIEGVAYLPGSGSPLNPRPASEASIAHGQSLYTVECVHCHGIQAGGDGAVAPSLRRKPANLAGQNVRQSDDGTLFLAITRGVPGTMPALREDLDVGERWDVVNYVRSLAPAVPLAVTVPSGGCMVRALDLLGAWAAAGVPETDPFAFTGLDGKACSASFPDDVRFLFTEANLWFDGALPCTACHGPDLSVSYAQMDLSTHAGILAGSRRTSQNTPGNDILGGDNWEQSRLYQVLFTKWMPLGRPPDSDEKGPLVYAGKPQ